jgi:23S rRNA pseudouridine2605 synthase
MNANADDATHVDTEAPAPGAEGDNSAADAPAKPARRKRAVKPAAVETTAADAPQDVAPATDEPAAAAKPARKRRAPKAAAESVAEAAPAESAATSPADVPAIATVHVDPRPEFQPLSPVAAAAAEVVAPTGSEPAAQPADGPAPASAEGEGGPRSERSRRRSRRDRRRGRGDEVAPIDPSQVAAADDGDDDEDDGAEAPPPVENLPPTDPGEVFAHVLSGQFDTEGEPPAEEPQQQQHKRVLRPEPDAPKLHKVLAQAGVGSRRDMEQLILDGKVAVNGQPAHIGQRISFGDRIQVEGRPVKVRIVPPPPRIIAYHKPVGEVVTHDDPQHRPTVFRRLPRLQQGKWQSVGRLDLNTEGLLLFTNSGELANQLMHPRFGVEREYAVRVLGTLDEDLKAELLEGVEIDGQMASFRSIEDGGGEGANHWYRVVITEGRNREVRRLFEEVGLTVSRLIRIRYGTVVLPRGLKRGVWVDLGDEDVRAIRKLASGGEGQAREERGGRGGRNKNRNDRGPRNDRNDRNDRNAPRNGPPRGNRPPDAVRADVPRDRDDRDVDADEDIDHSQIPNPLEQTFDKRFVQNPRSAVGGRGFRSGGGGFGSGGSAPGGPKKGSGPREPDPLQTSVGYIGADAFHRKGNRGGGRGGGGGGGGSRGGGGFGGGGGGGGGGRRGR